jgi:TonB family protein
MTSFNIKKKNMKTKNITCSLVNLKLVLVLPVIFLVLVTFYACAAKKSHSTVKADQEEPFVVVEEMPMFPGGDSTLLAYLSKNTKYPESAKTKKIQGRVIVRFCVTSKGSVDRISVLKGVSPELDAEASRVVSTLPVFKPGKQGGKPVPVWYMVPIAFSLDKSQGALLLPPSPPPPPPPPALKESGSGMTDGAYQTVDEMPIFPGGDPALLNYICANTIYPKEAKEKAIQGKVITRFKVTADGSVSDVSVLQGVNSSLDNEAIRVVGTLPKFTPGKLGGKSVAVWYMVPISFTLK